MRLAAVAALLVGVAGTAGGQNSRQEGALPVAFNRPRLGLTVDIRPRDTDSIGAYVDVVQPGSAAEKAGIRSGDIITRLKGQPVASTTDQRPAGLRLLGLASRLEPNTRVPIQIRRGTVRKTIWLVTSSDISFVFKGPINDSGGSWTFSIQPGDSGATGTGRLFVRLTSPLATLEMAPLNPELGRYFGTTAGVLVINNSADDRLPLQGGDVILAVEGRKPISPTHLMRMLQQRKTPARLNVLRHQKRIVVTFQP